MDSKKLKELVINERKEYFRNWRANNKDKVRQHNKNYWERRVLKKLSEGDVQNEK